MVIRSIRLFLLRYDNVDSGASPPPSKEQSHDLGVVVLVRVASSNIDPIQCRSRQGDGTIGIRTHPQRQDCATITSIGTTATTTSASSPVSELANSRTASYYTIKMFKVRSLKLINFVLVNYFAIIRT